MNKETEKIKVETEQEECPWCNSTGDVEKNRRIYWATVSLVTALIVILYILAKVFL